MARRHAGVYVDLAAGSWLSSTYAIASMENSRLHRLAVHLLATLAILPLLIPHCGETTLLRGDALVLLQGGAQGAGRDLGELVVAA